MVVVSKHAHPQANRSMMMIDGVHLMIRFSRRKETISRHDLPKEREAM